MTSQSEDLARRKADHIALCAEQDVEFRAQTTLLDDVRLHHQSLPELNSEDIDMSVELAGRTLDVPLMISGMTGGVDEAGEINRALARVAEERGMAFGVGSQRAMLRDPDAVRSYAVRDVAPGVFLFGNIGAVQARDMSTEELEVLVSRIGADALCVHLNPAQEMVQPEGDRDFRGCLDAIARVSHELSVPVVAKETGAGMSRRTAALLFAAGVRTVDVSGAGGTTWTGVETLRSTGKARSVGEVLWDWGIPTAVCVAEAHRAGHQVIASGGVRDGLDAARAIALGASAVSSALPYLRALRSDGIDGARRVADEMIATLRAVMLLTSSANVDALRAAPRTLGPTLRAWLDTP
jgi:isopentenyl-diphosphate delta-isomerase